MDLKNKIKEIIGTNCCPQCDYSESDGLLFSHCDECCRDIVIKIQDLLSNKSVCDQNSNIKMDLIKLSAQMAMLTNMPSDCYDDWNFPKGMQITSWRKVYDASAKAHRQCIEWSNSIKMIADKI